MWPATFCSHLTPLYLVVSRIPCTCGPKETPSRKFLLSAIFSAMRKGTDSGIAFFTRTEIRIWLVDGGALGGDARKIRNLRKEWRLLGRGRVPGSIVGDQRGHKKRKETFCKWPKNKSRVCLTVSSTYSFSIIQSSHYLRSCLGQPYARHTPAARLVSSLRQCQRQGDEIYGYISAV